MLSDLTRWQKIIFVGAMFVLLVLVIFALGTDYW